MSEEEKLSVEQDAQAVAQATETETEQHASENESSASAKRKNDAEHNWAEARKKMQQLDRLNQELTEKINNIEKKNAPPVVEEDYGIKDDDIVEGKHVKDLRKQIRQLETYIKQKEVSTVDERLSSKFPDFADVVTKENIEILKQTEPELANSLSHTPDPYSQGVAAYKLLKKLGVGSNDVHSAEKEKAKANSQKPVSVNTVSKQSSALGNAHLFENGLSKELKSQLWKEMQECAKRSA